jgi:5-methylcytosine-specific restriction enzyme subunit McrC
VTLIEMAAWSTASARLSHDQAAELSRLGLVDIAVEPHADEWRLRSDSRVGVAVGDGWELRVRPKLDIPKLFFLLSYARDPLGWKTTAAGFEFEPDLVDAVATAFSVHALRALEQGVVRGYLRVDERLPSVRGRIRFGDQLRRSGSFPLPVEVAYDDYTADVLENRLLTTAATLLLRLPRVPARSRQRLAHIRALLDDVSLIARPREAVAPPITRLNERYRPALRLAELLLRASSISTHPGAITATAFVFDMNAVFEDFVTAALREELQRQGGAVKAKWASTLDYEGGLRIEPDITWWLGERCVAVLDTKYKSLLTGGVRNPDAYQMLAYCTALQLQSGYLIYATDAGEAARTHTIRNVDREIHIRTVDLETPPEELLRQIRSLSTELIRHAESKLAA